MKKVAKLTAMLAVGGIAFVAGAAVPSTRPDPSDENWQQCFDAPPLPGSCYLVGRVCPFNGWCYLPHAGTSCDCP